MQSLLQPNERKLRFGIMCYGHSFPLWQARCIEKLLQIPGVEPALLIVEDLDPRSQGLRKYLDFSHFLWKLYGRLSYRRSRALKPIDLKDQLSSVPVIRCRPIQQGKYAQKFHPSDLQTIRRHNLDFILRFAFGILKGDILEAARYGVWSFHHDDPEAFRGGPPCFWEVYKGVPATGAILQRLTERLDAGIILRRGWFPTALSSYTANRDFVFLSSADWPAQVCRDLLRGKADYLHAEPVSTNAPIYKDPTNLPMIVFALKLLWRKFASLSRSKLMHDRWQVGIVPAPVHSFLEDPPIDQTFWIDWPKSGEYLADPFGLQHADRYTLMVEHYSHFSGSGKFAAISFDRLPPPSPCELLSVETPAKCHLSYPYLFEHENQIFCLPEMGQDRTIELWRAIEFPQKWEKVATLVPHFPGLDPTVFYYDGLWWLLACDGDQWPSCVLYAWYAEDLLGPWTSHPANPVKTDVRSARPAGPPFEYHGKLYRPAQDCSREYGWRLVINEIQKISPDDFQEQIVNEIDISSFLPGFVGPHTLSPLGAYSLIDAKKNVFTPSVLWARMKRRLQHF